MFQNMRISKKLCTTLITLATTIGLLYSHTIDAASAANIIITTVCAYLGIQGIGDAVESYAYAKVGDATKAISAAGDGLPEK